MTTSSATGRMPRACILGLAVSGSLLLAACMPASGPVIDTNPQAGPVEQIAKPSDGFDNEIGVEN
ncbi:hypothetical protein [Profundibacterium mesophilum]|uniref:Argininosuccinate lyase n=1 Tax=Profundibacterium mesophilum KAUST100406-0324 TaxID=1037889 RepID=A0A921NRI6_9RHOB|nr:hypothetical protein [Profundibacterium mesophilum]KAF0674974.1 hypothetical protein PMES_02683 [Profundibacterium mesophilum KAUST100406-0324]